MKNLNSQNVRTTKTVETIASAHELSNFDKNLLYVLYKAVSKDYKNKLFLRVESVSKSGMSRTIACSVIVGDNIINATYLLEKLGILGKNGRINGCGMDMLFETSYRLFCKLHPNKKYQDKLSSYAGY
jgi:hypothetical protein